MFDKHKHPLKMLCRYLILKYSQPSPKITCVSEAVLRSSPQASYMIAASSSGGRGLVIIFSLSGGKPTDSCFCLTSKSAAAYKIQGRVTLSISFCNLFQWVGGGRGGGGGGGEVNS